MDAQLRKLTLDVTRLSGELVKLQGENTHLKRRLMQLNKIISTSGFVGRPNSRNRVQSPNPREPIQCMSGLGILIISKIRTCTREERLRLCRNLTGVTDENAREQMASLGISHNAFRNMSSVDIQDAVSSANVRLL